MRDTINFKKDLSFKNNIAEISSISLECNYDEVTDGVKGEFLVNGSYRSHELSLNKENFEFKIPFNYTFKDDYEKGSALVNVKDFTYEIDGNLLAIDIEYEVLADKKENNLFEEKEEFERFLASHEVELDDICPDTFTEEPEPEEPSSTSEVALEDTPTDESIKPLEAPTEDTSERQIVDESIIGELGEREDTYITYHIHVCDESDTLESVAMKYKISIDTIKNYNTVDNIAAGMKLIIPCQDE